MNREQYKNKLKRHTKVKPQVLQDPLIESAIDFSKEYLYELQIHQNKLKNKIRGD